MPRKSNQTSVKRSDIDKVIEAAKADGLVLKLEDLSAYHKVEGPQGHKIYIQKLDDVRQVDLSEFGRGLPGTKPLSRPNGRVQAHLDLDNAEWPKYLRGFLDLMQTLPAPEKKKAPGRVTGTSVIVNSTDPEVIADEKAKRRALIEKVAKEKGVEISPNANL